MSRGSILAFLGALGALLAFCVVTGLASVIWKPPPAGPAAGRGAGAGRPSPAAPDRSGGELEPVEVYEDGLDDSATRPRVELRGGVVSGAVVDAATRKPLANVRVRAYVVAKGPQDRGRRRGMRHEIAMTDERGRYSLTVPASDSPTDVRASHRGYSEGERAIEVDGTTTVDFELERIAAEISGTVVDSRTGKAPASYRIQAVQSGFLGFQASSMTTRFEGGPYRILLERGKWTIEARSENGPPLRSTPVPVDVAGGETLTIDFSLEPKKD